MAGQSGSQLARNIFPPLPFWGEDGWPRHSVAKAGGEGTIVPSRSLIAAAAGFLLAACSLIAPVSKSGVLNLPGKKEKVMGGHAVMSVGYDDSPKRFIVR